MSYKGFFRPKNPAKYKGDPTNIVYRSSWEVKLMSYLDAHPDVVQWASEELIIPYRSPLDNRLHRYFPDFWVKKRSKDGTFETLVIEVKPLKQTKEPTPSSKKTKQYLREVATWAINQAKWNAAKIYCEDRKWKFITMTEQDLGIKF
jgi:hypothetical protein